MKKSWFYLGIIIASLAMLSVLIWFGTRSVRARGTALYLDIGQKFLSQNQIDQALIEFRKAALLSPRNSQAHLELGKIYKQKKEKDRAITEFEKAAKNATSAEAYYQLAEMYIDKKQLDKAEEVVYQGLERAEQKDLIYSTAIKINLIRDNSQKLKEILEVWLGEDPNNRLTHFNLAVYYLSKNQLDQSQKYLNLSKQGENEENSIIGLPSKQIEELEQAIEATRRTTNQVTQKIIFAQLMNQLGIWQAALPPLKKVVEKYPGYRDAQIYLAYSYILAEKLQKAEEHLNKAREIDPNYALTYEMLVDLASKKGEKDKVTEYQQRAKLMQEE